MVKADYRTPKQARRDYPSGSQEYIAKLIRAKWEPEKHSTPICYKHVEGLAQSGSQLMTNTNKRINIWDY